MEVPKLETKGWNQSKEILLLRRCEADACGVDASPYGLVETRVEHGDGEEQHLLGDKKPARVLEIDFSPDCQLLRSPSGFQPWRPWACRTMGWDGG